MAFHISEYKEWQAGPGTPVKYSVGFELDCTMTEQTQTEATFSLTGVITVVNHPNNSQNVWPASDFAVLTLGGYDPINYQFTDGVSYYQSPLPALPNAPQSYLNAMRVEFRGDTARPNPNRVSLWISGQGNVIDTNSSDSTWTYNLNQTFTIQLTGNPAQEVLIYTHSGARNSTGYDWLQHDVWATLFNFDYRPGASWSNGGWQSHNRASGKCNIWTGNSWKEMRTDNGGVGSDNPPLIYGSSWKNQRKIGIGG